MSRRSQDPSDVAPRCRLGRLAFAIALLALPILAQGDPVPGSPQNGATAPTPTGPVRVTISPSGVVSVAMPEEVPAVPTENPVVGTETAVPLATVIDGILDQRKFIRIHEEDGEPTALQTEVVRYVPADGSEAFSVDLVSVIHIGDGQYYRRLNRLLRGYDSLLYELVAPQGVRPPKGGGTAPISVFISKLAKLALDLDFQVDKIDYHQRNFVHADMSPQDLIASVTGRGDDWVTLGLGLAAEGMRQYNLMQRQAADPAPVLGEPETVPAEGAAPVSELEKLMQQQEELLRTLGRPDGAARLKRLFAEQLAGSVTEGQPMGELLNRLLIDERNGACMEVLKQELRKGNKKVGIFYGAAHMPDFERRLMTELGLKRAESKWLDAWDLKLKPSPLGAIINMLQGL